MEGEIGSLSENIEREFKSKGSKKEGSSLGLKGCKLTSEEAVAGEVEGGVAGEVGREG